MEKGYILEARVFRSDYYLPRLIMFNSLWPLTKKKGILLSHVGRSVCMSVIGNVISHNSCNQYCTYFSRIRAESNALIHEYINMFDKNEL